MCASSAPEVWHGAWKNTSNRRRYLMQIFYGYGTLATHYPPLKYDSLYNPEVLKQATPRQRKLLGGPAGADPTGGYSMISLR